MTVSMSGNLFEHIIFDLDGTLSDSREGIYNAAIYMSRELGLPPPTDHQFANLIGPPLQQGLKDVFHLEGKRIDLGVKSFREYYGERGLYENAIYPGIQSLLQLLLERGKRLYVATAKLEPYARKVLGNFGILDLFSDIAGADYNGLKAGKEELVLSIMQRNGISDPDAVVLIGDSRYDIHAASAVGIDSIGVAYGFSTCEEMASYDPDYLVKSVDELTALLTG